MPFQFFARSQLKPSIHARCCLAGSRAEAIQDTCRAMLKRLLGQCTLILCARSCVKGFGLAHAHTLRKVLLKEPIMYPHPSNDQKVLQTIRFRQISMMAWDGLRFLEFIGPLKPAIPKGPLVPSQVKSNQTCPLTGPPPTGGATGGGLKRFVDFVFRCSHSVFELAIARLGQCRQIPGHASDPNPRIASGRCALKILTRCC